MARSIGLAIFTALMNATIAAAADAPHIVYILADDMGHGDVRALREACKFPTPHLDRLVNEGMAFTQAYSGSAICSPTRYGIMTGRYCWRDGVGLASGYTGPYIEPDVPTVAEFLRAGGYRTRMVGKWHLGGQWTGVDGSPLTDRKPAPGTINFAKGISGGPVDQGFQSWFGIIASLDMPPYVYLRDRVPVTIPTEFVEGKHRFGVRPGMADPNLTSSAVLGDFARESVRLIQTHNPEVPLFLYLALNAPHSPVAPSSKWQGRSELNEHADFRMEVDHTVGRVLESLESKGMADNTLVIFTADNGSAKQAVHGMREHGHDSCDGRRGWKATWFEGGHRVPFLARWPQGIQGEGRFDDYMITLEDLFATVADILGQPLPVEAGDSVSFLPQLQGKPRDRVERQLIMSSLSNKLVLRHGKWKLICVSEREVVDRVEASREDRAESPGPNAAWHEQVALYDMKHDVAETTNMARENSVVVAQIAGLAIDAMKNGRTNRGPARPNSCSEPQMELLTRLGTLTKKQE